MSSADTRPASPSWRKARLKPLKASPTDGTSPRIRRVNVYMSPPNKTGLMKNAKKPTIGIIPRPTDTRMTSKVPPMVNPGLSRTSAQPRVMQLATSTDTAGDR